MKRFLLRWSVRDGVAFLYRATEIGADDEALAVVDNIDDILAEMSRARNEPLNLSIIEAETVEDAWSQVGKSEAPSDNSSALTE